MKKSGWISTLRVSLVLSATLLALPSCLPLMSLPLIIGEDGEPSLGTADKLEHCLASTTLRVGKTTQKQLGTTSAPYGYIEYLPGGYSRGSGNSYPLIIMLHGLGEQGNGTTQLGNVAVHGPNKRISQGRHFPAVILTPQSPTWWNTGTLKNFLTYALTNYDIDESRVYVTGLSMGGGGTWDFLRADPDRIAAVIPVCGASGANGSAGERRALESTAIWAFHSVGDGTVTSANSRGFMDSLGAYLGATNTIASGYANGQDMTAHFNAQTRAWEWVQGRRLTGVQGQTYDREAHYTQYADSSHDSWTRTYADEKVWEWLFCQKK